MTPLVWTIIGIYLIRLGIRQQRQQAKVPRAVAPLPPVITEKPLDHMPFIEPNSFVPNIGYSGY